jgi:hypothetical protein
MTTLADPVSVPVIGLDLSNTDNRERLHDLAVEDMDNIGHAPPCPKGKTCDCPRSKVALGLAAHACNPDPMVRCVVFYVLTKEGVLLA